jgi:hypothetical protein
MSRITSIHLRPDNVRLGGLLPQSLLFFPPLRRGDKMQNNSQPRIVGSFRDFDMTALLIDWIHAAQFRRAVYLQFPTPL